MKNIETIKTWNIEAMTGYKPRTTFYEDFSIADHFGAPAVRDTYCRAFNSWQNNIEYMTELVMVLNWKIGEHYSKNYRLAEMYDVLWRKAYTLIHNQTTMNTGFDIDILNEELDNIELDMSGYGFDLEIEDWKAACKFAGINYYDYDDPDTMWNDLCKAWKK